MLNGGLPASKEEEKDDQIKEKELPDKNNNAGVFVVSGTDGQDSLENPLIPDYKERMAGIIA